MRSASSIVRSRSRSKSVVSRISERDERNPNALNICTAGKDIYSSVLGPTVDETLLLGLQTFLGIGSNGEDGGAVTRARLNSQATRRSINDVGDLASRRSINDVGDLASRRSINDVGDLASQRSINDVGDLASHRSVNDLEDLASRMSTNDFGGEEEQVSVYNSVLGNLSGIEGAGAISNKSTRSIKSTRFAPCRYRSSDKYLDQDVQTLPPEYTIKCNKAVACPPKCRVGMQVLGDDDILVDTSDSMVGTDQGFNFGGQTAGPHICACGSQTGDLINTSSSQTSRITLSHAPVQTQRRTDSATYSLIPQMSNKQLSTSSELLPGLEDCSCSTDSIPEMPMKRKPARLSQRTSLSRCTCGRSCPTLQRRPPKKKNVRVCCDCHSTTTGARTDKSCPSFACMPSCVGDTNQQGIPTKYAITKITTFASYTTFEVMKCTRKKPRCMPSSIMGVFVLKNFDDCNC